MSSLYVSSLSVSFCQPHSAYLYNKKPFSHGQPFSYRQPFSLKNGRTKILANATKNLTWFIKKNHRNFYRKYTNFWKWNSATTSLSNGARDVCGYEVNTSREQASQEILVHSLSSRSDSETNRLLVFPCKTHRLRHKKIAADVQNSTVSYKPN